MNERVSIICTAAGNSEGDAYLSKRQNDWRDSPPYDRGREGATSPRLPVGSRTGAPARPKYVGRATFPAPSTSNATCGFPALRSPIRFMSRLMGPILPGRLSARCVELDSR